MFSRAYRHFGGEKNREKHSFRKSGWASMDSPFSHILPFSYRFYVKYFFFIIHAKKKSVPLTSPRIWCCIFLAKQTCSSMYYKYSRLCKVFRTYCWIGKFALNRKGYSFHRNTHPILMKILGYIQFLMLYRTHIKLGQKLELRKLQIHRSLKDRDRPYNL